MYQGVSSVSLPGVRIVRGRCATARVLPLPPAFARTRHYVDAGADERFPRVSALRLERVSKHWGATKAVDEASFGTPSGALVVLLGPSGCGKSTTLRMIAGLDAPSAGRILIDERDVTHAAPAERRISMVFLSYALFPHLSV